MLRPVICVIACIGSSSASADISFDYEGFSRTSNGAAELILKFTNDTEKVATFVKADCAILNASGKAVSVNPVIVQNLSPHSSGYGRTFALPAQNVVKADCRLISVDYAD